MRNRHLLVLSTILVAAHAKPEPPRGYNYPQPAPFPNRPEVIANNAVNSPCTACQLFKQTSGSNSGQFQIPSRNFGALREPVNSFPSQPFLPPSRSYGVPILPEQPPFKQTAYTVGSGNNFAQQSAGFAQSNTNLQAYQQPAFNTNLNSNGQSPSQLNYAPPVRQYLSPNVNGVNSGFSQSNYAPTSGSQVSFVPSRQYLTPNIATSSASDLQGSIQNNYPSFANAPQETLPQTIQKHIYIHVAPPDEQQQRIQAETQALARQKHYKIIFIKTPTYETQYAQIRAAQQAQNEEKTLVYVLVKKPDAPEDLIIPTAAPTPPSKPEVYFIKYKSKTEAIAPNVPAQIQQQQEIDHNDSVVVEAPRNSNANAQASASASASASANTSSEGFRTYGVPAVEEANSSGPYKK